MNLRDYLLSFHGRVGRKAFPFVLPFMLALAVAGFMIRDHVLGRGMLGTLFLVAMLALGGYLFAAVAAKRTQDQDRHGAWMLLWFLPLMLCIAFWEPVAQVAAMRVDWLPFRLHVAQLFMLWGAVDCLILPGTPGENRFGPEPERD